MTLKINKGDKVRLIDTDAIGLHGAKFTKGKIYTAIRGNDGYDTVRLLDDDGEAFGLYTRRFELVVANGVDKYGNPKDFNVGDLKALQRVVTEGGRKGIIAENVGHYGTVIIYEGPSSFDRAQINGEAHPSADRLNIVEVYENPGYGDTYSQDVRGGLIWKRDDAAAAKAVAIKAADEAIAKARKELTKAEATRAAL